MQPSKGVTKVTWISHATVLIQDGPVNIITDPVFVDRIVTYRRLIPHVVSLQDLPRIDIILISHDHNDHFDEEAVRYLVKRDDSMIVMGMESGDILDKNASRSLLDWTECVHIIK